MRSDGRHFRFDLLPAAPFLMFKMAVADGPNDDRAKAPTIPATPPGDGVWEQTGGLIVVRPGWLWGVASGAKREASSPHITRVSPMERRGRRILRNEIHRVSIDSARLIAPGSPHRDSSRSRDRTDAVGGGSLRVGGIRSRGANAGRMSTLGPQTPGTCVRSLQGEEKS